jgi:hypothetical protein
VVVVSVCECWLALYLNVAFLFYFIYFILFYFILFFKCTTLPTHPRSDARRSHVTSYHLDDPDAAALYQHGRMHGIQVLPQFRSNPGCNVRTPTFSSCCLLFTLVPLFCVFYLDFLVFIIDNQYLLYRLTHHGVTRLVDFINKHVHLIAQQPSLSTRIGAGAGASSSNHTHTGAHSSESAAIAGTTTAVGTNSLEEHYPTVRDFLYR